MYFNRIKTAFLLGGLSALLLLMGKWLGGHTGVIFAFFLSLLMNFIAYFFSDTMVLSLYGARPLEKDRFAFVYTMVEELCQEAAIPMPKLWHINLTLANAFATGRNPQHSSIALTQGIIDLLDKHELRGVLAHELSHIKNRDVLVATVAATLAMAIGYLADMIRWAAVFGTNDSERNRSGVGAVVMALLMPFAALLIQLTISRSREYLADETGANCCHDPLALASALEKLTLDAHHKKASSPSACHTSTAGLFIVYPFMGNGLMNLFSTHPPLAQRIERLRRMAR